MYVVSKHRRAKVERLYIWNTSAYSVPCSLFFRRYQKDDSVKEYLQWMFVVSFVYTYHQHLFTLFWMVRDRSLSAFMSFSWLSKCRWFNCMLLSGKLHGIRNLWFEVVVNDFSICGFGFPVHESCKLRIYLTRSINDFDKGTHGLWSFTRGTGSFSGACSITTSIGKLKFETSSNREEQLPLPL